MMRTSRGVTLATLLFCLLIQAREAPGAVFFVKADATGVHNGQSWAEAFADLQAALLTAHWGDEIWVAAGTYKPTSGTDRTQSFSMKAGVALWGGFTGKETVFAQRDSVANPTILSGDIGLVGDRSDNSYHVVAGANGAVLDGFTITAGNASDYGGGMINDSVSPTVSNCTFSGNSADSFGGGIFDVGNASPTIINCTFSGNSVNLSHGYGGAINDYSPSSTIRNCTFTGNSAFAGGGITVSAGSMTISGCIFSGNTATGGGIYILGSSSPSISNCVLCGNTASGGDGGGIYDCGSPSITNCTLFGNSAKNRGGGIFVTFTGSTTVNNCIICDNNAPQGHEAYNDNWQGCTITYRQCAIQGSGSGALWDRMTGTDGGGNIATGPMYVDPYHPAGADGIWRTADDGLALSNGSPCINNGNASAPAQDILGRARVDAPDIGAYEYVSIIYVKPGATGAHNGTSWADAYTDLQAALAAPNGNGEIWVAAGTYKPTSGTDRTKSFMMVPEVKLYGGFVGTETAREQRDWTAHPTILSGDIGVAGDATDNSYHVVVGAEGAVLDGFTVTGGYNKNGAGLGGGMFNDSVSPTVANCLFSGNTAVSGGGMYNNFGSPVVNNCTFSGNSATGGGGMYTKCSTATLTNCTFSGNSAGSGGGMDNENSAPVMINCTFSGNSAVSGSGMYSNYSTPMLISCILWGDTASEVYTTSDNTPTFRFCDIQGSGGSGAQWDSTLGVDGGGNIAADPQFVDAAHPAGADGIHQTDDDGLALQVESPCISGGQVAGAPALDILGHRRDVRPDIGAYEFDTVYVNAAAMGANNGTSWADAYTDLQAALAAALPGAEIWVAAGTYKPTSGTDRSKSFLMAQRVDLYGGFAGTETARLQRDWVANPTILSGGIDKVGKGAYNSFHVITGANNAVLDGFTITGAKALYIGGGMINQSVSPTIRNCTFSGNSAQTGDAMYLYEGGGGMYIESASPSIINCTFSGNTVQGRGASGGGIYLSNGSPAITGCTFSGNTAGAGGGIYLSNGSPSITGCTFCNTTARARGGGIYNNGGSPLINNCLFSGNVLWGGSGGGLVTMGDGWPTVTNCTFTNNSTYSGQVSNPGMGGGIYKASALTVINCTFSGNAADMGGGICNVSNPLTLINCILWGDNGTVGDGIEVYNLRDTANCIHCAIQGSGGSGAKWNPWLGTDGGGNIDQNPLFVDAAHPAGADGRWFTKDDGLALGKGSPCINAGTATGAPLTDILGRPRLYGPDIGAYEDQTTRNGVAMWSCYQ